MEEDTVTGGSRCDLVRGPISGPEGHVPGAYGPPGVFRSRCRTGDTRLVLQPLMVVVPSPHTPSPLPGRRLVCEEVWRDKGFH